MDIEVGSNLYRNSNGIIDIEGVPQFEVAIKQPVRALLVNFALFDEVGRMMAKVVDSNLTFNERRAYQLAKSPTSVSLKHEESGTVVFALELREGNRVVFSRGSFHTIKGHRLDVSQTEWRIDKKQFSGKDADMQGGSVFLGQCGRVQALASQVWYLPDDLGRNSWDDHDLTVFQIDDCRIAIPQLTLDQLTRHRGFDFLLNQPLQRSGSIDWIITPLAEIA